MNIFQFLFGTKHSRDVKRLQPVVRRINEWDERFKALSDDELKAKTPEFRERLAKGETLDDLLPEAFAVVKNACRRLVGTTCEVCGHTLTWDMVPFDVQLMGGIVLHQGKIAEMQTGEGKTLVATAPLYLNALTGKNVQLVTVNDYLALRDSQWMGHLYTWLGVTVGCIQNTMTPTQRREQYACDITYGTNSEFGFDYLRDNGMAQDVREQVQRDHYFAIVDEVDSILIDEARTPLIISGPAEFSHNQYKDLQPKVERLYRRQVRLVDEKVEAAKKAIAAGEQESARRLLYQVYHGMPKNKVFMSMIEDPAVRRLHEDVESMMLTEMHKDEARELREALFFVVDEKMRDASLTDKGCAELNPSDPEMFVVPDIVGAMAEIDREGLSREERDRRRVEIQQRFAERSERIQNVAQLLKAYTLYEKDVEYVVQDNKVLIVDEFTGRILPGRRWSDGLHQAVEAKEGVEIERETQTLATITIQNYFRLYKKLSGMTGTAETEAQEFNDIYRLDVVVIPTNRPIRRVDENDQMYKTQREKFAAIIADVTERHRRGQPVLIGTVAVETSETLSRLFREAGIPHNVLNAKNHAREAEIVALAGQKGAVTIATNMAGRGTDIKLGEGVVWTPKELIRSQVALDDRPPGESRTLRQLLEERPCGLHVIGSERHESRRIDRQLRGRCARQGDPGSSRFYVSLEDNLMRLFGHDRIAGIMTRLGMQEGEPIEHRWLNHSIESAQRRVEERNFSIRKRTLEYDDVMNRQRSVIYDFRSQVLANEDIHGLALDVLHDMVLTEAEERLSDPKSAQPEDYAEWATRLFPVAATAEELKPFAGNPAGAAELVFARVEEAYELKCSLENREMLPRLERFIVLRAIDREWQDYLRAMDDLRDAVRLRAYGQRDPLIEYKREASGMFDRLMAAIKQRAASGLFRASTSVETMQNFMVQVRRPRRVSLTSADPNANALSGPSAALPARPAPTPAQAAAVRADAAFDRLLDRASASHAARLEQARAAAQAAAAAGAEPAPPAAAPAAVPTRARKPGRNDPCPCGSGKKYKNCHGKN